MNLAYVYVLVPILIAIIINVIIYTSGWVKMGENISNPMLPPGWAIGLIWVIILGILGYALYLTVKLHDTVSSTLITILIIACLIYPFYTAGLSDKSVARMGNTLTLIGAFIVAIVVGMRSPCVLGYIIPILVWISYVNVADAVDN